MENETTIFGIRAVIEAIKSGENIDKLFLQKGLKGDLYTELEQLVHKERLNSSYVPLEKLNRLTKKNHQGVVVQKPPITFYPLKDLVIIVMESS
ncbi:MAG: hypothetical protein KDC68_06630 [Gelidibacter sp.]|nr:hypothetical protein [Gelidibacter sp.]